MEMKYVVKFELNESAKGTQNEEEFIPVLICREHELQDIQEMLNNDPEGCESHIVDVRVATAEDEEKYTHYYC